MRSKFTTALITGSFAISGAALAQPQGHARGHDLPPGLAKQGKVPPGHAKETWQRGEHLPHEYREYQFNDWALHGLQPAPAGHRWVRIDDDAYLTDVTTELVAQAMIDLLN